MRLTSVLSKWPKNPPNGNIWIGRHRMTRKVEAKHHEQMRLDVEREKRNALICLKPFVSREREGEIQRELMEGSQGGRSLWWRMRRTLVEGTTLAPVPLQEHFKCLRKEERWE